MKAFPALLLAATLLAPTLRAQEAPAAPTAQAPLSSSESPVVDAPAPPTPDLTPAQDVPTPKPDRSLDLMPAQDATPAPAVPEPALIPDTPAPVVPPSGSAIEEPKTKDKKGGKKEKANKTQAAADELATRVRFRQVKTRALKDPAIQAEWTRSEKAHTDYEKREALKRYYKLLYTRMEKIDSSLKKEIAERQTLSVRRLNQTRIDQTEAPDASFRAVRTDFE